MAMKATLILADAAQAVNGKLYILGGGWSMIAVGFPFAVAGKIDVPWSEATETHTMRLALVDADGNPVETTTPEGSTEPVVVEDTFRTGIPAQVKPGTPIDRSFTVAFPPLPFEPDARYEFRLTIDDRSDEDWTLPFSTFATPPLAQAA